MNYSDDDTKRIQKKRNKPTKKIRNKTLILVFRVLLAFFLVGIFAVSGIVLGAIIGIIEQSPQIGTNIKPSKYTTIFYVDGTDIVYDKYKGSENREFVTADKIPQYLKDAIVAVEDERFYSHNGVDLKGIIRATFNLLKSAGGQKEGASTITQQLIKNTVTKVQVNTLESKIREQYLALKYEKALKEELGEKEAKDQILLLYLNTISLHYSLNGVQTAAKFYFDKDVSELNLAQCAVIAAITNNPSYYEPIRHSENNKKRQGEILGDMLEQGYINQDEYDQAIAEDVYATLTNKETKQERESKEIHTYYSEAVFNQIKDDLREKFSYSDEQASLYIYDEGLKVNLPIDLQMQKIVDDTYRNNSLFPRAGNRIDVTYLITVYNTLTGKEEHTTKENILYSEKAIKDWIEVVRAEIITANKEFRADRVIAAPQPQSAFVLLDYHNGYVKAIAGGRGDKTINRPFNRAIQSTRQPGSVFKVLAAFAPAIDSGKMNPGSVVDDVPFSLGKWSPKNWWGTEYRGLTTIRDAIKTSANVVTVRTMSEIGIDTSINYLLNFGISTLVTDPSKPRNDLSLSTALGGITNGVLQTEIASAYGTIANLGYYNRAKFYTTVYDKNGELLLDANKTEPKQVLKEGNAYILTDMMKDVITGTGSITGAAAKLNRGMPVAGKTGTTSETLDLTFVGYTPYYLGSVWLGFDDGKTTMQGTATQREHMIVWKTIMDKVHENLEVKDFPVADNIIELEVCADSGLLPTNRCYSDPRGNRVRKEKFVAGFQPTAECDVHVSQKVCTVSNKAPNDHCPSEVITTRVGLKRKVPYTGTAYVKDRSYEIRFSGGICTVHNEHNNTYTPPKPVEELPTEPPVEPQNTTTTLAPDVAN